MKKKITAIAAICALLLVGCGNTVEPTMPFEIATKPAVTSTEADESAAKDVTSAEETTAETDIAEITNAPEIQETESDKPTEPTAVPTQPAEITTEAAVTAEPATAAPEPVKQGDMDIFARLAGLSYQPETCDGIPECSITAPDGTTYAILFGCGCVWRYDSNGVSEAALPADVAQWLSENGESIGMIPAQWN